MSVVKFRLTRVCTDTECLNCRRGVSTNKSELRLCRACVARGIDAVVPDMEKDLSQMKNEHAGIMCMLPDSDVERYARFRYYMSEVSADSSYTVYRAAWATLRRRIYATLDSDTVFNNAMVWAYNIAVRGNDIRLLRIINVIYRNDAAIQRDLFK